MKYRLSVALAAGLLMLSACAEMQARPRPAGPPPGGPTDPVPQEYLRGTEFDKPNMMRFSWGLEEIQDPDPNTSYYWPEIRRRLAQSYR